MFGKEDSDCPGNSKANSRAKQIKVLLIVFLSALIIGGQLSVINAAGPYSPSEVPLGRTIPALTKTEQKLNFWQKNLKTELPQVKSNWQKENTAFLTLARSRFQSLFDQLSERFFQRFLEKASPRLIIVNPKPEPTPTPISLTPVPTYAASPTPTINPVTPTPTLVPTAVPTATPTVTPTASPTPTVPTATPTQVPVSTGGYSVAGGIIQKNGQPLALNGVNWFGFETANNVVHGLWSRSYKEMIAQMKAAGFNSLRIPFCPNTVANGSVSGLDYNQNPDLQGLKSLEILDKIVEELDRQGMTFVLDHHRPDCNAISELPASGGYSESAWIADLVAMTNRYKKYGHFLGMDLKNEPHGAATWGTGDSTDWKLSAEKAGKAVLAADPNILVFVEGIQNNPDCSDNAIAHWWGGNLEPQACYPINLPTEKLVLSPHVYGPDVFPQDYFNAPDFPNNLPAIWEKHFGFLAGQYALAIGEWGGRYQGKDAAWQNALVDYLAKKGICNSFYWSWNPNSGDTGGILQDDWRTLRQDKVDLLRRFASQCRQ
jgi:endoglucanase